MAVLQVFLPDEQTLPPEPRVRKPSAKHILEKMKREINIVAFYEKGEKFVGKLKKKRKVPFQSVPQKTQ